MDICRLCLRAYSVHQPHHCGEPLAEIPAPVPTTCQHRSPAIGKASCGCGFVYRCQLLGILCGDKKPVDEFVDFQGTFLTESNYRVCSGCELFSA